MQKMSSEITCIGLTVHWYRLRILKYFLPVSALRSFVDCSLNFVDVIGISMEISSLTDVIPCILAGMKVHFRIWSM